MMWQDFKYAKENFPKVAYYMIYKPTSYEVFSAMKAAIKLKLRKYKPHTDGDKKFIVEQKCKTFSEAEYHKKRIESFLLSSEKKILDKPEIKKAQANRTIKGLIKKHKDKLIEKFCSEGQVMAFLNKFSIYISYIIIET